MQRPPLGRAPRMCSASGKKPLHSGGWRDLGSLEGYPRQKWCQSHRGRAPLSWGEETAGVPFAKTTLRKSALARDVFERSERGARRFRAPTAFAMWLEAVPVCARACARGPLPSHRMQQATTLHKHACWECGSVERGTDRAGTSASKRAPCSQHGDARAHAVIRTANT